MKAYRIIIKDPMQTPAIVYETRKRAEQKPLWVLLDHQEQPNVVRGASQPFEKHKGIVEIKRPDGGLSWYHSGTYCLMIGETTGKLFNHQEVQQEWGDKLKGLLHLHGYDPVALEYENSDIFFMNGKRKHLIGMSGWIGSENGKLAKIQRACWYEQSPMIEISDMLRADKIDPKAFEKRLAIVEKGFYAYLSELLKAQEISAEKFISKESQDLADKLQKRTFGTYRGSCV